MPRRNRAPYAVWEQLWQIFCPWVTGTDDIPISATRKKSPPRSRQKQTRALVLALLGAGLLYAPCVQAAPRTDDDRQGQFLQIALSKTPETPLAGYPSLFGKSEKRYEDLKPFTKWSGVLARFADQLNAASKTPSTRKWLAFLQELRTTDPRDQITAVNQYMNKIPFIDDKDNYNVSDYWATPMQFLKRGGDCEDYAIAKYVSLRALGFKEEQLRIAIVYDTVLHMPHAVLIVYEGQQALVLDNQAKDVKPSEDVTQYAPIYSINQYAWWRH